MPVLLHLAIGAPTAVAVSVAALRGACLRVRSHPRLPRAAGRDSPIPVGAPVDRRTPTWARTIGEG
ncbi:hypothetical protein J2S43_005569 [Catenuloplanes nepalensis]|uniref:Secreted protein n=1 Tax=Catenuloplanes nepalensis TaxID=587533 RepID=A0ABT9N036_9ACTN|nr:hypothetical protein [Catenuloplanes nepalensis]MDP9797057.1 hypothetical protein [Catenuloplanes nepalensis]